MSLLVEIATAASGVLFLGLAAFVAAVRPRTRANLAFAGYAGSYGLYFVVYGVALAVVPVWAEVPWPVLALLALCVWTITPTLALLVLNAPRPLMHGERRILLPSGAVAVGVALLFLTGFVSGDRSPAAILERSGVSLAIATITGGILFLTLRFHVAAPDDGERRFVTALLAASLLLQQGMWAGEGIMGNTGYHPGVIVYAANIAFGMAWLWIMIRGGGLMARRVAWTALGSVVAGMLMGLVLKTGGNAGFTVGRTVASVVIAYAILRHQLLGIDVKVRWGVSRGTMAAAFVAVFFIASEAAQQFLGETTGSEYLGIAAAGALVFAIVPLQRAAERFAERAVPVTDAVPPSVQPIEDRLAAYRLAVAAALRDDARLTPREETHLADLAQALGVGAGDALRVRREMESTSPAPGAETS